MKTIAELEKELLEISSLMEQEIMENNHDTPETNTYNGTANYEDFILEHGKTVIPLIQRMIQNNQIDNYATTEMLTVSGQIHDPATYEERIDLLVYFLDSERNHARLGAIKGLLELYPADKKVLMGVAKAVSSEAEPILQHLVEKLMDKLIQRHTRGIYEQIIQKKQ